MRAHITALLWSTRDREQARGSLRQSMHELNELFAPLGPGLLFAERDHIRLRSEGVEIDTRAVMRATVIRAEALALLRAGPLLEDLIGLDPAFDRWLLTERQKLAAGAASIAEAILSARIAERASPATILAAAQGLLAIDPLRETGWRASMTSYTAMGERASAMDAFERCSATLAELVRLSPSAETRAVYDSIRTDPPPGPGSAVTLPSQYVPTANRTRGARLGVMPFRVLGATDEDGLSFGLADEITTALSRFRWIFLIASPSIAAVQSSTTDNRLRTLGLDFLLEGTVQARRRSHPRHGPPA